MGANTLVQSHLIIKLHGGASHMKMVSKLDKQTTNGLSLIRGLIYSALCRN